MEIQIKKGYKGNYNVFLFTYFLKNFRSWLKSSCTPLEWLKKAFVILETCTWTLNVNKHIEIPHDLILRYTHTFLPTTWLILEWKNIREINWNVMRMVHKFAVSQLFRDLKCFRITSNWQWKTTWKSLFWQHITTTDKLENWSPIDSSIAKKGKVLMCLVCRGTEAINWSNTTYH